jgi:hypothetical protein
MDSSPADSSTDKDFKHILRSVRSDDRRQLWSRTQLACLNMAVNVGDHVRSLSLLLSQPSVGIPIYARPRGVLGTPGHSEGSTAAQGAVRRLQAHLDRHDDLPAAQIDSVPE